MVPEGLGGPPGAGFGPNCRQLVRLGWSYGYHTLCPGIGSPLGPKGPQQGPFWPKMPLLGALEVLGGPPGVRFGPNCRQLVRLGWSYGYLTLWPDIGPPLGQKGPVLAQNSPYGPQKGPFGAKIPNCLKPIE